MLSDPQPPSSPAAISGMRRAAPWSFRKMCMFQLLNTWPSLPFQSESDWGNANPPHIHCPGLPVPAAPRSADNWGKAHVWPPGDACLFSWSFMLLQVYGFFSRRYTQITHGFFPKKISKKKGKPNVPTCPNNPFMVTRNGWCHRSCCCPASREPEKPRPPPAHPARFCTCFLAMKT